MQYLSTRGQVSSLSFSEAVMMGLAEDGGLLLPRTIPRIGTDTFASWQDLSYTELAYEVMSRFIDDIPGNELRQIINQSYASFSNDEITPLVHQGSLHILELFHGPTYAFKDVALQFLGNIFSYLLEKDQRVLNILGATSGDTGSAAIYGVRGKDRVRIFILHPRGRVSRVQELQMTTVLDDNVFNLAIEGNFDDGQAIVKQIFNDIPFKTAHSLGAINSINWARVLAQVVYYVHSCIHVTTHEKDSSVDFSIPTGNFGDIFAGYIAKKMLPQGMIRNLILATNENDILSRWLNQGVYQSGEVKSTTSPSMDIQAASNFERYLYYLTDSDAAKTRDLMEEFATKSSIDLSCYKEQAKRDFSAFAVSNEEVNETIASFYKDHGYILDPHTAVGVKAAEQFATVGVPMVCLATAHPAKFADTVEDALDNPPQAPAAIEGLLDKPTRVANMPADSSLIRKFIEENALQPGPLPE